MNKNIIRPIVLLVILWWIISSFVFKIDPDWSFEMSVEMLVSASVGIVIGTIFICAAIYYMRKSIETQLSPRFWRGLSCTIGYPPVSIPAPAQSENFSIPENRRIRPDSFKIWLHDFGNKYPFHAEFMRAIMRVLNANSTIPASTVEGGHGGVSLYEHSVLVAGLMIENAIDWKYTQLTGKDNTVIACLKDQDYKFNRIDPLVFLVGLCHDLGKIECLAFDEEKRPFFKGNHDLIGSRMLARLDEFWELPREDQLTLQTVVGYHHHPHELPLDMEMNLREDRIGALMGLLIYSDTQASAKEYESASSHVPIPSAVTVVHEPAKPIAQPAMGSVNTPERSLLDHFIDLMSCVDRINNRDPGTNLGQKFDDKIVLHEPSLRSALLEASGGNDEVTSGGRSKLIQNLLVELDKFGILYKKHDDTLHPPDSAYFNVRFYSLKDKDENGGPKALATWMHSIIIVPGKKLQGLSDLPNYTARMEILSASGKVAPKRRQAIDMLSADAIAQSTLSLLETCKTQKTGKKPAPATSPADSNNSAVLPDPVADVSPSPQKTPPVAANININVSGGGAVEVRPLQDGGMVVTPVGESAAKPQVSSVQEQVQPKFTVPPPSVLLESIFAGAADNDEDTDLTTGADVGTYARMHGHTMSTAQAVITPPAVEVSTLPASVDKPVSTVAEPTNTSNEIVDRQDEAAPGPAPVRDQPAPKSKVQKEIEKLVIDGVLKFKCVGGGYKTFWELVKINLKPGFADELELLLSEGQLDWCSMEEQGGKMIFCVNTAVFESVKK